MIKSEKTKHGGKREGAGRPPSAEPTQIRSARLTDQETEYIRALGFGSLAKGIRVLLAKYGFKK